jgi:hypothetical protein
MQNIKTTDVYNDYHFIPMGVYSRMFCDASMSCCESFDSQALDE